MSDEEWFEDEEVYCQNPGCDGTAIWSGGAQKAGRPAPTQCNECYVANRDQEDETITCSNCQKEYTYRAKYIVYYRRNIDKWETPDLCRFCMDHPDLHHKTMSCQNASHRGGQFELSPQDQFRNAEKGLKDPELCYECYVANRNQQDEPIVCSNCKEEHTYRAKYIIYYRRNVGPWVTPKLCRFCTEHPDLHPIDMTCQNVSCGAPFVFTPRWQKRIADKGQEPPALCDKCREANRAQKPVRVKCVACEADYTYRREYIISFKRKEGEFEGRNVCRLCFEDPQRAKRIKEKREEEEKKRKEKKEEPPFEDIVGWYLRNRGTDEEKAEWRSIVDENTYEVPSNVQSYEILTGEELYARIVEIDTFGKSAGRSTIARDHILYGKEGTGHGWDDLSFDEVLGQAGGIAEDTDSSIIECRDSHTDYIIKYDTGRGVLVIICESEDEITRWRVKSTFQPSQSKAAEHIRTYRWVRMI